MIGVPSAFLDQSSFGTVILDFRKEAHPANLKIQQGLRAPTGGESGRSHVPESEFQNWDHNMTVPEGDNEAVISRR